MRALVFVAAAATALAAQSGVSAGRCQYGETAAVFNIPSAYESYVRFSIPYYNFSESAYVWATNVGGGALKLSYNSGASVFIQNNLSTGLAYQIYAAEQSLACTATQFSGFNTPFPDLSQFRAVNDVTGCPRVEDINGVDVYRFDFNYTDPKQNTNSASRFDPPNQDGPGYVGIYRWYQNAKTGAPVRFHTIVGHNVVFGGSHVDEYIVDYISFQASQAWPEAEFFLPPAGMPCTQSNNPFGPTVSQDVHKANLKTWGRDEPTDFHSMFPEGAARRRAIADAHAEVHSELLNGTTHSNHAMARLHTSARYVAGRNRYLRHSGLNYTVGLNGMAHLTHEERLRRSTGFRPTAHTATAADFARIAKQGKGQRPLGQDQPADECSFYRLSGRQLPNAVDLTRYTFPAKDQGTCGSCWSFGATGAIEGALWRATGQPKRASQQNLMDCSWYYGNAACGGGNDYTGFSFLIAQNQATIATEEMYGPYLNKNGFCHYDLARNWTAGNIRDVLQFKGCVHVNTAFQGNQPTGEELTPSLRDALYTMQRPISVAIDATQPDFYYYTGGYYYDPNCGNGLQDLDHQVLAVGYTTRAGIHYTRVKNSWSNHWGEDGFVWISQKDNNCGVATSPNFITTSFD